MLNRDLFNVVSLWMTFKHCLGLGLRRSYHISSINHQFSLPISSEAHGSMQTDLWLRAPCLMTWYLRPLSQIREAGFRAPQVVLSPSSALRAALPKGQVYPRSRYAAMGKNDDDSSNLEHKVDSEPTGESPGNDDGIPTVEDNEKLREGGDDCAETGITKLPEKLIPDDATVPSSRNVENEIVVETGVPSPEEALARALDVKLESQILEAKGRGAGLESANMKEGEVVIEGKVGEVETAASMEDELGEPPERPLPGDCCGQGCEPCVWDTYNDELRNYLARKKALQKAN